LIGALHKKFGPETAHYRVESQDQMYHELREEFDSNEPKVRVIIGVLKGLTLSLEDDCTLEPEEVEGLFIRIKTAMQQIPDVRQKGVQKQAMKLFTTHVKIFRKIIPLHAEAMVKLNLTLCVDADINVRDAANDMLGNLMRVISDGLTTDETIHKDIFQKIVSQFKAILDDPNNNVQLISAIRAIGVFSKAIKVFLEEETLKGYLDRLIELSEQKLIKEFEDQRNPEEDTKNFKFILKKQKQLISYIESYSFILGELTEEPSEKVQNHFFRVCTIGVCNHRKLLEKYRHKFYEALVALVMSLSKHKQQFSQWIRKFVRKTLQETLKIPDAAIFGAESPEESLKDAIQFWREWLNKDQLWSQYSCNTVYDELICTIIADIKQLNLTYRVVKSQQDQASPAEEDEDAAQAVTEFKGQFLGSGLITFQATNNSHQQYLKRLADFLEILVPHCRDEWFLKWIPLISEVIIKKSIETPRICALYQILTTSMQVCSRHNYFDEIR